MDLGEITRLLKETYRVTATPSGEDVRLRFEGLSEEFILSSVYDELMLRTDCWHEHFSTANAMFGFLDRLFSGRIRVVVKFRGKTPVGHQIQELTDDGFRVVSWTCAMVPLFWRRKSFRTMKYVAFCKTGEVPKVANETAPAPKRDPLAGLLPKGWPDRILALVVTMIISIVGVGLAVGSFCWHTRALPELMIQHGMLLCGVSVIVVCVVESIWLLFQPAWAERFVRRHVAILLLPLLLIPLVLLAYLIYYVVVCGVDV